MFVQQARKLAALPCHATAKPPELLTNSEATNDPHTDSDTSFLSCPTLYQILQISPSLFLLESSILDPRTSNSAAVVSVDSSDNTYVYVVPGTVRVVDSFDHCVICWPARRLPQSTLANERRGGDRAYVILIPRQSAECPKTQNLSRLNQHEKVNSSSW
jgi:hypothetical protein